MKNLVVTELTEKKVYRTIRELGITSKYKGYSCVATATLVYFNIVYCNKEPILITKDVYPEVASKLNEPTSSTVERDIRTAVNVCWENNRKELEKLANKTLDRKPTNSEFLDLLAYYIYTTE